MESQSEQPGSDPKDSVLAKLGDIPAPAVRRLSLYLRQLERYLADGKTTVSSKRLGADLGVTDAQVRKDFAYFGQFGHPGVGYQVDSLIGRVRRILGTDHIWNVVLVGAGNLGNALSAYRGFARKGFQIVAVVDSDPAKVGLPIPSLPGRRVQPMEELEKVVEEHDIRLAVLAVPADAAEAVVHKLAAAGVRGILNFAPVTLAVPPDVAVVGVDLAVQLEQLSYQVSVAPFGREQLSR